MIVDDDKVSAALAYLADENIAAVTRYATTMAENHAKTVFARLFLMSSGPVAEREARAGSHADYIEAKRVEAEAIRELERHRAKVREAEMVIEIWRTESANARTAEKVR